MFFLLPLLNQQYPAMSSPPRAFFVLKLYGSDLDKAERLTIQPTFKWPQSKVATFLFENKLVSYFWEHHSLSLSFWIWAFRFRSKWARYFEKVVFFIGHMGVSKNRGAPKWMVYNGKPYQNGWFGGTTIFGNIHIFQPLIFIGELLVLRYSSSHTHLAKL